ncbi:MAG: hypothetical protein R3B72_27305 [Polyangiaceae bacterium]
MRRRELLGAAAAAVAATLAGPPPASAEAPSSPRQSDTTKGPKHHRLLDLDLGGDRRIGQRMTLLLPAKTAGPPPLLVLLHGLGETHDQKLGARAWVDRYGLSHAYDRLVDAPVARLDRKHRYWSDEALAEVNAKLAAKAFRGLAIACPYTPNVHKSPLGREVTLDRYRDWILERVLPRARKEAGLPDDAPTFLDGCSLGGYVAAELYLRAPERFQAWGSLQGALGQHRIGGYAERFAKVARDHGPRPIHLETSTEDVFRDVNQRFSKLLREQGVDHQLTVLPGPHNQPFLRDSGTLTMLLWYDRLPR